MLAQTLVVSFCVVASVNGEGLTDEQLLPQIRATYQARADIIRTMQVRYRKMPPLDAQGRYVENFAEKKFEWTMSGHKQLLKREPWKNPFDRSDSKPSPEWDSFDSVSGYQVVYWPSDPERVSRVFRTKSLPVALRDNWIPVFLGLRLPYSPISLAQQLNLPATRIIGREPVNDTDCIKVELAAYEPSPSPGIKHRAFVWFSVEHEWALAQIHMASVRCFEHWVEHPTTPYKNSGDVSSFIRAVSFMSSADSVMKRQWWFPSEWTVGEGHPNFLEVDEIILNQPIDSAIFAPPRPVGAELIDMEIIGKPGDSVIVGGEDGLAVKQRMMNRNRVGIHASEIGGTADDSGGALLAFDHNAQQTEGISSQFLAILVSAGLFLAVLFVSRRQRSV